MTHPDPPISDQFLTTPQAAHRLGLSPRTLERYRCQGSGPVFHKMGGRVLYDVQDIRVWVERIACHSTSEAAYEAARSASSRLHRRHA